MINKIEKSVDVALYEHRIITDRVFEESRKFERVSIQVFVMIGAIYLFAFNNFDTPLLEKLVNLAIILLVPLLVFSLTLVSIVSQTKMIMLGEYLYIIEKRINNLLEYNTSRDESERIIGWEYWRLKSGFGKTKHLILDNAYFFVVVGLFVMFISGIRLNFVQQAAKANQNFTMFYILVAGIVISLVIFVSILLVLVIHLKKRIEHRHVIMASDKRHAKCPTQN